MLVLMRRLEEELIIGDNIRIKIVKIQGNQVHLGIEAPKDISIFRGEIYERVKAEKAAEALAKKNDTKPDDKDGNCLT